MKLRLALAAATCLALPLAAHAQPVTGPYVSLEGGTSILNPVNTDFEGLSALENGGGGGVNTDAVAPRDELTGKFQFHIDYAAATSIGYGFGDGFRAEISGDFIRNTVQSADLKDSFGDSAHLPATGAEEKYGPMFNVLYDIPIGLPVYPYVGAGVGYQWVKLNRDLSINSGFGESIKTGGTAGSFAYDIIGGLSYPLPWVPGLSLTAEYRFMMLTESRSYQSNVTFGPVAIPVGKTKLGQESSHTFLAGLRYSLFPPAPPAPPPAPAPVAAPAPAPAKTYLVFFDWDKYNLTPRATQIIAQAASDSKTQATTVINVSGYTDTSGTAVYNMGLSQRRARAVAAQLVTDGISQSEISIHAYGETHLLVPTGPGVREPQNRRVEIVLD